MFLYEIGTYFTLTEDITFNSPLIRLNIIVLNKGTILKLSEYNIKTGTQGFDRIVFDIISGSSEKHIYLNIFEVNKMKLEMLDDFSIGQFINFDFNSVSSVSILKEKKSSNTIELRVQIPELPSSLQIVFFLKIDYRKKEKPWFLHSFLLRQTLFINDKKTTRSLKIEKYHAIHIPAFDHLSSFIDLSKY